MQDVALSPIRNAFIFLPAKWVKFLALSAHMSLGRFFWNKGCELGLKMHNQDEHIITNDKVIFFPLLQYLWNPGVLSIGTSTFWFESIISQQELTI